MAFYHPGRTITRADISEAVSRCVVGLSRSEAAALFESVLTEVADTLVRGETVGLSGFGSFVVNSKSERVGRNPKTRVEVTIEPRRVMTFRASPVLKRKVHRGSVTA